MKIRLIVQHEQKYNDFQVKKITNENFDECGCENNC